MKHNAIRAVLLTVISLCFVWGCHKRTLNEEESINLTFSKKIAHVEYTAKPGGIFDVGLKANYPNFPADGVEVSTKASSISLAVINSPSISNEDSTVTMKVIGGKIPGKSDVTEIVLRYSNALLSTPFIKGNIYVFRFTKEGDFFDIKGLADGIPIW